MRIKQFLILTIFLFVLPLGQPTFANQPIVENRQTQATRSSDPYQLFNSSLVLGDPTFSGFTVYGMLSQNAINMYYFIPKSEDTIPIEVAVPAKSTYATFFPRLTIVGKYVASGTKNPSDIPVPVGFESITTDAPINRTTFFDSLSLQTMYQGSSLQLHVLAYQTYFVAVTDPANLGGSYALRIGSKNNFSASVKDTATTIDPTGLVFENYSPPTGGQSAGTPTSAERKLFPEQKTPFETLDSRIRLWTDLLFFYLNRIPAAILNK